MPSQQNEKIRLQLPIYKDLVRLLALSNTEAFKAPLLLSCNARAESSNQPVLLSPIYVSISPVCLFASPHSELNSLGLILFESLVPF